MFNAIEARRLTIQPDPLMSEDSPRVRKRQCWHQEGSLWNTGWVNALQLLLLCLAGWLNRNQQFVIEYLQEEVKVLRELLALSRISAKSGVNRLERSWRAMGY